VFTANLKPWKTAITCAALILILAPVGPLVHEYNTMPSGYVAVYPVLGMWLLTMFAAFASTILLIIPRTRFLGVAMAAAIVLIPCTFFAGVKISEAAGFNRWIHAPMVRFGPDVPASLVIYYKIGANQDEINKFEDLQIFEPRSDGHGRNFRPGIRTFLRLVPSQAHGHNGFAIDLEPSMQKVQRDSLVASLLDSPMVFKVYRDIAPAAISDPGSSQQ